MESAATPLTIRCSHCSGATTVGNRVWFGVKGPFCGEACRDAWMARPKRTCPIHGDCERADHYASLLGVAAFHAPWSAS
jgi:hypothetical protein